MNYRREIDGLRALAVVPVILFHAGFETFSGGFVGVDVFFVISGYLITTIILAELEQEKFSIVNFYERRARRILPALFLVMLVCIPLAWLWLLPRDMKDFSQSLVAVSVFASNILFWHESGYFDTAAELKPLLHTWSLSVEEQYYVLFPLFLMLFWRLGKQWILTLLVIVGITSLGIAQWASVAKPIAAFFLLPTRGWELLIGAFAAFYLSKYKHTSFSRSVGEIGGWLGLALILYSVFVYSKATPFPGLYALVPTVGTVLIILFATQQTTVGKFVGNKAFVAVGLISYSAYLWHQPLFAFARHRSLNEPSHLVFAALSFVTIALAYYTWKFVEKPFRSKNLLGRKFIFTFSGIVSVSFLVIGLSGHLTNGYKFRIPEEILSISSPLYGGIEYCGWDESNEPCYLGEENVAPTIAIIGDSHTDILRKAFSERFAESKISALSYGKGWCAPLLDVGTRHPSKNPICRDYINESLIKIISDQNIKIVVIHAEWANYTKGFRWNDPGIALYTDAFTETPALSENINVIRRGLHRTIEALHNTNKIIILVKSVPEYGINIPKFLVKNHLFNNDPTLGLYATNPDTYRMRNLEIEELFKEYHALSNIHFVEPVEIFCPNGSTCNYTNGKDVLYTDGNHLSFHGALLLVDQIINKLH